MKLEHTFFVGVQTVTFEKELSNKALVEMLSDITMFHGFRVGDTTDVGDSPVSWIVLNWKVEICQRARLFSNVRVVTWISSYTKLRSNREYIVYNEDGEILARAAAVWVARKGTSKVFCRLKEELMAPFGCVPDEINFPGFEFRNFMDCDIEPSRTMTTGIYPAMLDYNRHIHNSEYLNLADQIIPEEVDRAKLTGIEIYYKQEIEEEKTVLLEYAFKDGCHQVAARSVDNHILHALVELREA